MGIARNLLSVAGSCWELAGHCSELVGIVWSCWELLLLEGNGNSSKFLEIAGSLVGVAGNC